MNPNTVLNICFGAFIIIMGTFYKLGFIKNSFEYYCVFIAVLISIIILFSKSIQLLDFSHFAYFGLYFLPIALFSNNKYFLSLNILMLFNIILSRQYFHRCILNDKQNNKGFFYSIGSTVSSYFDWFSYYISALFIVTLIRLYTLL